MYTNVQIVAISIYARLQNVVEIKTRCDRSINLLDQPFKVLLQLNVPDANCRTGLGLTLLN